MDTPSDGDLVRRIAAAAAAGKIDREAERILCKRYARRLYAKIAHKVHDETERNDLRQECYRRMLEKVRAGAVREPDHFHAFIFGIADNLCFENSRHRWRHAHGEIPPSTPDPHPDPVETVQRLQISELVQRAIGKLKVPRDQVLLRLRYVNDYDKRRICMLLGLTPDQFDRAISRARKRFADGL